MGTALWPCGAWPPMSSCPPPASPRQCTAWPSTPGMLASWPAWAKVPLPCGCCSSVGPASACRCRDSEGVLQDGVWLGPRTLLMHAALVSPQVRREPIPEEVGAGELTSLCFGATPLLYCGSNTGRVCVWDASAGRCFLAWDADDGEIGGCPGLSPGDLVSSSGLWGRGSCHSYLPGVLLCSGARLLSGSNTRRLRLWAVGAVPELRCKGSRAR